MPRDLIDKSSPTVTTEDLCQRIKARDYTIGIMGLGYVGLPLALVAVRAGFKVIGFDIDERRVALLNRGESGIAHIETTALTEALRDERFRTTSDFSELGVPDAILIAVPTPLNRQREPDLTYVENSTRQIAARLRPGQLVVLESTTWPGTTTEVLKPLLEGGSLLCGRDFFLAFSPEREDPGNTQYGTATIPKVVGADDDCSRLIADALYKALIVRTVPVSSAATAEAVKLTENIFRSVNIALVNELKVIYGRMGINVWEVIEAANTKPFGYMPFYPGPGLGGHCIPIDPFYLTWKAREFNIATRFIELAGEINRNMPNYVIAVLAEGLSRKQRKALNGANVLVVGIAYKKNIDDIRESPSLVLMELLAERGVHFDYYDPFVPVVPKTREHAHLAGMKSINWSVETINGYDAILISTDHDQIDWQNLVQNAKLVVDTRNVLKDWHEVYDDRIIKA